MWLNLNGYAFRESVFCKPQVYIVNEQLFIKCPIFCFYVRQESQIWVQWPCNSSCFFFVLLQDACTRQSMQWKQLVMPVHAWESWLMMEFCWRLKEEIPINCWMKFSSQKKYTNLMSNQSLSLTYSLVFYGDRMTVDTQTETRP